MNRPDLETSSNKHNPIIIQSEGPSFNARILLNKTNNDMWSQIIEMHIVEKEKLSFIRGTQTPTDEEEGYEKCNGGSQSIWKTRAEDELQTLDYEVHMSTNVMPNNQETSMVDTNVDLYRDTNGDNGSQSGNQDIGVMETNDDDFQP
ncbi:hypothetical protein DKX38_011453 [Salix brachista]|uniref:Uncharacterized protein n=1 Tax=Salix brachista TaxID=2182728 RepID=A0A5N5LZ32_9ROSI|nr:hypothetical protein DKX38_011453 [Salix brachista]